MWTYYNGLNPNNKFGPGGGGLYWTTEKDFDSTKLTDEGKGWSKQTVLSYYYNPKDKTYSVIENRAWLNQPGSDRKNHNGLAQLPVEHQKPEGNVLGTYDTYAKAQEKYNAVKAAHKGDYIYMGTTQTK